MKVIRTSFLLFTFLIMAGRLFAQAGATGTILGTVTDTTGAIVSKASVTITNVATGTTVRAVTSSSGEFNAPSLNPGTYSISITAPGFERSVTEGFMLAVDQKFRYDVALHAGSVNETVQVATQAVSLDTDSSAIGQLVSQRQVQELPAERAQLHAAADVRRGCGDRGR